HFLYDQLNPHADIPGDHAQLDACSPFQGKVCVFNSAVVTYFAPSDQSGIKGMHRKIICVRPSWHGGPPWYDCMYVVKGGVEGDGFQSLMVARV
ncbi:hypothetical protein BKA82DRAFT_167053, partial [Pisolithus tinctorius]